MYSPHCPSHQAMVRFNHSPCYAHLIFPQYVALLPWTAIIQKMIIYRRYKMSENVRSITAPKPEELFEAKKLLVKRYNRCAKSS